MPTRRQALIWANDGKFNDAYIGLLELTNTDMLSITPFLKIDSIKLFSTTSSFKTKLLLKFSSAVPPPFYPSLKTWTAMNEILNKSNNKRHFLFYFVINDQKLSGKIDIANQFNTFCQYWAEFSQIKSTA